MRAEYLDRGFQLGNDLLDRFDTLELLIDHADANAAILRQRAQDFEFTRARRAQLKKISSDIERTQRFEQRLVIAGETG